MQWDLGANWEGGKGDTIYINLNLKDNDDRLEVCLK
jgi:hypothetical protein